ncbi:MAG: ATP-binding cassette domain-containing protein, partial [Acidimicrobiales bacterium]
MSILSVTGVSRAFGGVQALQACSLEVDEGSIAGLIGPNGSGKTTLFNVVTGYVRADQGAVRFRDEDITGLRPNQVFARGIGRT